MSIWLPQNGARSSRRFNGAPNIAINACHNLPSNVLTAPGTYRYSIRYILLYMYIYISIHTYISRSTNAFSACNSSIRLLLLPFRMQFSGHVSNGNGNGNKFPPFFPITSSPFLLAKTITGRAFYILHFTFWISFGLAMGNWFGQQFAEMFQWNSIYISMGLDSALLFFYTYFWWGNWSGHHFNYNGHFRIALQLQLLLHLHHQLFLATKCGGRWGLDVALTVASSIAIIYISFGQKLYNSQLLTKTFIVCTRVWELVCVCLPVCVWIVLCSIILLTFGIYFIYLISNCDSSWLTEIFSNGCFPLSSSYPTYLSSLSNADSFSFTPANLEEVL